MERFKQLQEAKEVLCDDIQRKAYDYWRNSHITVPWKTWHSISERSQPVRNTAALISRLKYFLMRFILSFRVQLKHSIKRTYRAYVIAFGQYLKKQQ